jgi:hypothetical protein
LLVQNQIDGYDPVIRDVREIQFYEKLFKESRNSHEKWILKINQAAIKANRINAVIG